jgi:hypothetical protein
MDEEKLIILVQGHECLYNLQHKDYDNHLVKDNCWKEIAGVFSFFFFFAFLLLQEVKSTNNGHILLKTIHTYDCKEW